METGQEEKDQLIDIHTHILPGIDDGARNLEVSLEMAKGAEKDGISHVVASPHVMEEDYGTAQEMIRAEVKELNRALSEEKISVEVLPGAEVHVSAALLSKPEILRNLSINSGGKYVLLEFPLQEVPKFAGELIFKVLLKGLVPILAHPERNLGMIERPEELLGLVEKGALVQMNAGSITGKYGESIKDFAETIVCNKIVHFVASDAHSARNRPIMLSSALVRMKELIGDDAAKLVLDNPLAALNGETLEVSVPRHLDKPGKKIFSWVSRRLSPRLSGF